MFIVFEGLDSAGKSTLLQLLAQHLDSTGQAYICTREPGGSELGEKLRHLLLWAKGHISARAELLMYQAARAQHVEATILPALKNNKWVLCDRFAASSLAFQQGGRQLSSIEVEELNRFATGGLQPHLYVLLDVSVDESCRRKLQRAQSTGVAMDRFEKQDLHFHSRVRESYLQQAQNDQQRWCVLDATCSPQELLKQLLIQLQQISGGALVCEQSATQPHLKA